jgi:hypothetical protein
VAVLSTAAAALLGTAAALLVRSLGRARPAFAGLFQVPLPVLHVVAALCMLLLLAQGGMVARLAHAVGFTVGFSPPAALRALADHLDLTGPVLSDENRTLYRLLGFGRAPVWRVYSPATLAHYASAVRRGHRLRRPVEDPRQLGGDALAVDGVVVRRWRPSTPEDRAAPSRLAAAAAGTL